MCFEKNGEEMDNRQLKITSKTKCDLTTDALLAMIARGEYKAGDRLPTEKELTEMFSVSRVTIREAIKRLNSLGMVTIRQGDGTYLNQTDANSVVRPLMSTMVLSDLSIEEIYDARLFVEVGNVRLAARNRTEQDLNDLKELLQRMEKALDPYVSESFSFLDNRFHEMIGKISGNYVLSSTYSALEQLLQYYINTTNHSFETAKTSMFHHQHIVSYIEERNEYLAGVTMEQHVDHAKRALLQKLTKSDKF